MMTLAGVKVLTFLRAVFLSAALATANPGGGRFIFFSIHHNCIKFRSHCCRLLQALNATQASTGFTPAAPLPFPTATRQLIDLFRPSPAVMLNTDFTCKSNKKKTKHLCSASESFFTSPLSFVEIQFLFLMDRLGTDSLLTMENLFIWGLKRLCASLKKSSLVINKT